ncbi:hypothetical protein BDN70DRAFT_475736 [Pholiota conissans]|uniref:Uncharacterized protein n=1 Tax=Pholiota conissans TaxID=109636 RepID=A0A9P5YRS0_9AGAR|nr:hypothetical protein BDN70DRAFT_475736 [Pholiota conissans]
MGQLARFARSSLSTLPALSTPSPSPWTIGAHPVTSGLPRVRSLSPWTPYVVVCCRWSLSSVDVIRGLRRLSPFIVCGQPFILHGAHHIRPLPAIRLVHHSSSSTPRPSSSPCRHFFSPVAIPPSTPSSIHPWSSSMIVVHGNGLRPFDLHSHPPWSSLYAVQLLSRCSWSLSMADRRP